MNTKERFEIFKLVSENWELLQAWEGEKTLTEIAEQMKTTRPTLNKKKEDFLKYGILVKKDPRKKRQVPVRSTMTDEILRTIISFPFDGSDVETEDIPGQKKKKANNITADQITYIKGVLADIEEQWNSMGNPPETLRFEQVIKHASYRIKKLQRKDDFHNNETIWSFLNLCYGGTYGKIGRGIGVEILEAIIKKVNEKKAWVLEPELLKKVREFLVKGVLDVGWADDEKEQIEFRRRNLHQLIEIKGPNGRVEPDIIDDLWEIYNTVPYHDFEPLMMWIPLGVAGLGVKDVEKFWERIVREVREKKRNRLEETTKDKWWFETCYKFAQERGG